MCGILGLNSHHDVAEHLIEGLKRLEYRGYDSAGIATVTDSGLQRRRASGKISNLEAVLRDRPCLGSLGIGHTRWATHGAPTETNAHPHLSGRVALVHNGIIENYRELKTELESQGRVFESETDTEVIAHLIDMALDAGHSPAEAFHQALGRLTGAFGLAVIFAEDRLLMGARQGSPLVVGLGEDEMVLGSDAIAVAPFTRRVMYLEDGDWCVLSQSDAHIFDAQGVTVQRPVKTVAASAALAEKGNYRHFMQKEIHEQPEAISRTLSAYVNAARGDIAVPEALDFRAVSRIQIIACGTAYYAGAVARDLFARYAHLPVDIEVASEFRYRTPPMTPGTLAMAISQSGETADTLAALKWCKAQGLQTAALVNVHESSMAREADIMLPTHAGPEIGVASTKAFTAQLSALSALVVAAGRARGVLSEAQTQEAIQHLLEVPRLCVEAIECETQTEAIAHQLLDAQSVLYIGRGAMASLAYEGALKLKEISYIHAEGYAAGELKHGPIALVDEHTPIVALAPSDEVFEKTFSNIQEVAARGGKIIMISDAEGLKRAEGVITAGLEIPASDPLITPLVATPSIQMLAYHTARLKGADVDQPRNLAKSVTVE